MRDPILHAGVTDRLPEDHPWAWKPVTCIRCGVLVHSIPNETMEPWVETGQGAICWSCFQGETDLESFALPGT